MPQIFVCLKKIWENIFWSRKFWNPSFETSILKPKFNIKHDVENRGAIQPQVDVEFNANIGVEKHGSVSTPKLTLNGNIILYTSIILSINLIYLLLLEYNLSLIKFFFSLIKNQFLSEKYIKVRFFIAVFFRNTLKDQWFCKFWSLHRKNLIKIYWT